VFGLGSAQVVLTLAATALVLVGMFKMAGSAAIIVGASLALSSTAVALQVLQDRSESSARHGRATFSVLLFQDLAVVVILMLIPLLSPGAADSTGALALVQALTFAAMKAVVCITAIMFGGRLVVKPLFKKIAALGNPELFAATTLLVCLGTSVLTQVAGLSMELGAFLAGLVIAETEFALQVESDIAPYRGLLLGLFFMTVGMEISPQLFANQINPILWGIALLLVGKSALMVATGSLFGLSRMAALRSGLYLAPGGEFAFVALGESVSKEIIHFALCQKLFLVVALSMALTPYLAAVGSQFGAQVEQGYMKNLQPSKMEVDDLRGHVIICGFGRSGQLVAQLLSERLIPFVALDVRADQVQAGKQQDLRVYFGDAGNRDVLHKVGAEHAACAVVTLDSPGANYRTVWALRKHYPEVKIFSRAHDINHGINLEKAGATAVIPETLEPSLQLAAEVLGELDFKPEDVATAIDDFRRNYMSELMELSQESRFSLGYGYGLSFGRALAAKELEVDGDRLSPILEHPCVTRPTVTSP
jgi:Kef-type K+ transport system membrane component KefB